MTRTFTALIHKEGDWYVADCPEVGTVSQGKTVEAVTPLTGKQGAVVVIFTDGTFLVGPPLAPEAWELGQALVDARTYLEPRHQDAYKEYDRLARKDKDALRSARLEKIIGAIQNNVDAIPELKERLKSLVQEWK